jgi:hypothetical protein
MAAAADLAPRLPAVQRNVLSVIAETGATGATSDEIAAHLGWERWAARPRTSELRNKGVIIDSGRRRVNPASGKYAIVWILAKYGEIAK